MKKLLYTTVILSLIFSVTISSCKKKAPAIPPESTFVMPKMDSTNTKSTSVGYGNFLTAFGHVAVWTTIIEVGLIVPKSAFVAALKQTPKYLGDSKWVWEYQVNIGFKTYVIQLYGTTANKKEIRWDMYVSSGEVKEFLWFYGVQNEEGNQGYWIIYKSPTENHELLRIDWTRDEANNTGTLKYTNIEPEGAENGGYIEYGNNLTGLYNCFYNIYNKGQDKTVNINYNTSTHIGRIKAEHLLFDQNWHCWNQYFLDDYCPDTAK